MSLSIQGPIVWVQGSSFSGGNVATPINLVDGSSFTILETGDFYTYDTTSLAYGVLYQGGLQVGIDDVYAELSTNGLRFADGTLQTTAATGGGGGGLPLSGGTMTGNIAFGTAGQCIGAGTFDTGKGGSNGISLVCSLGYEFNWQAGWLTTTEQNSTTPRPLYLDSYAGTSICVVNGNSGASTEVKGESIQIKSNDYPSNPSNSYLTPHDLSFYSVYTASTTLSIGYTGLNLYNNSSITFADNTIQTTAAVGGFSDAPADGTSYTRNNNAWTQAITFQDNSVQYTSATNLGFIDGTALSTALGSYLPLSGGTLVYNSTITGGNTYFDFSGADSRIHFNDTNDRSQIGPFGIFIENGNDTLTITNSLINITNSSEYTSPRGINIVHSAGEGGFDTSLTQVGVSFSDGSVQTTAAVSGFVAGFGNLDMGGYDITNANFNSTAGQVTAQNVTMSFGGVLTFGDSTTQLTAGIPEAPIDGNYYVRKDGAWVQCVIEVLNHSGQNYNFLTIP